jgi:putative SOS response-associated peptidase YedK
MCYHYAIFRTAAEISDRYGIEPRSPRIIPDPDRYHVSGFDFPSLPVVYPDEGGGMSLSLMQWGLVPGWVKDEEQSRKIRQNTLNARGETADTKPSFRAAFRNRPCLVPATGYFEWLHHQGKKYPFFIFVPSLPLFSFAGIWDEWVDKTTGETISSFSIITCEANSFTAKIHNTKKRMPVILRQEDEMKWVETGNSALASRKDLLKPFDSTAMDAYSISRLITDRNRNSNVPEVIEPFVYPTVELP